MRKSDLQFIKDTTIITQVLYEPSIHKNAQEGLGDVMSIVKDKVSKLYDPNNPIESILAFMGPGLLWMFGFKWVAVLYEVAEALGFNWAAFFTSIKNALKPLLEELVAGKSKSASDINSIVQDSANTSFNNQIDPDKLEELANKTSQSVNNMLFIKKLAQRYSRDSGLKGKIEQMLSSATGNRMRKGVLGFIVKLISWVLAAVLIAAGFKIVGSAASSILKTDSKNPTTNTSDGNIQPTNTSNDTPSSVQTNTDHIVLNQNPNVDQGILNTVYNDNNHIWLLHFNVSNIKHQLIEWAQELYPQLTDTNAFDASSAFNRTLKMFQDRNKEASQLEILAVPQPFTSIKSIVDSFAADVAAHMN